MIYVMSDIHGNMNRFNSIMSQINLQDEDTLYILGDVIDRYPDGIKILRKIMKSDNIKMLLGNHEYMMLEAIDPLQKPTEWEREDNIRLWYRNGGNVTHNHLKHIRKSLRREIFDYLYELPLNIKIEVGDKKYLLVHGSPLQQFKGITRKYSSEKEFAVWHRWQVWEGVPDGYTMIFGHTPTINFNDKTPLEVYIWGSVIGIDCGSGYGDGRLACVRLDDMKIFYSEEQENKN